MAEGKNGCRDERNRALSRNVGLKHVVQIAAASCAVLVLYLRASEAFNNPQIWAEDGKLLWGQQYTDGLIPLFKPYASYHHLLPRVTAAVVTCFDPHFVPILFTYAGVIFVAWFRSDRRIVPELVVLWSSLSLCFSGKAAAIIGASWLTVAAIFYPTSFFKKAPLIDQYWGEFASGGRKADRCHPNKYKWMDYYGTVTMTPIGKDSVRGATALRVTAKAAPMNGRE